MSPTVNLVSSAITPIKIQDHNNLGLGGAKSKQLHLIDTFNTINLKHEIIPEDEREA